MMGLLCSPLAPFLPLIRKMMLVHLYPITLLALLLPQAETDVTMCECWVLFPALFPSVQLCILFSSSAPVLSTCGLNTSRVFFEWLAPFPPAWSRYYTFLGRDSEVRPCDPVQHPAQGLVVKDGHWICDLSPR